MEQMKMEYEKPWNVKVVRRRFETTSIEQLEDSRKMIGRDLSAFFSSEKKA